MSIMTGVVEAVARTGKSIKIGENWYSAFTAGQLNGASKGDNVSFTYKVTEKAGTTYYNIQGSVSIKAGGEAPAASEAASGGGKPSYAPKGGRSFPVGPLDPERSIIRQNSLTQANALAKTWYDEQNITVASIDQFAEQVIDIARLFESYSAGDMDAAEAAEAVESLRAGMTKA